MENGSNYKIPLSELLAILKANGYEVSVERILEIQSVLLSTDLTSIHTSELKFIIAPILAKNVEEQNNIHKIIDAYVSDRTKPESKPIHHWVRNKRMLFGLKVTGFVVIMVVAILLFLFQKKQHDKDPRYATSEQSEKRDSTIRPATKPVKENASQKITFLPGTPAVRSELHYNNKPIVPIRQSTILQMACAFGLGLGAILYYIIFYERKRIMQAKKNAKEERENAAIDRNRNNISAPEQLLHASLRFPENNYLVQKTKEYSAIRSNMKRPVLSEDLKLEVNKSVNATTRSAGFPALVFDAQLKERRWLVLIDNTAPDSHLTQLWHFLIHFLESADIPLQKYFYSTDVRTLNDYTGNSIALETISHEFADHDLVIFGDCRSFLENGRGLQKNLAISLYKFASRSIITPFPMADWSFSEQQLQNESFRIIPSEISAVELLSNSIANDASFKSGTLSATIKDHYSVSKYEFKAATDIKEYLNNEALFQIVCSLAVYPRLDWNLTLALFSAIAKRAATTSHKLVPDHDTLLKIARIPWLHAGQLSHSMRLELLDNLNPEIEIIARETLLVTLKQVNPFVVKDSPAFKELKVQFSVNAFFLHAHDPDRYKQYADVKKDFLRTWDELGESPLKQRKNSLMPLDSNHQPTTVEEFVLREEQFEKRNVSFLRIVLLTLPAAILYILFFLFRPPFVYPGTLEKVSFMAVVKKDSTCSSQLSSVIISKLDRFDTIALDNRKNVHYLPIDKVDYNRNVGLSFSFTDGRWVDVPVEAKDSLVEVLINCR